MRVLATDPSTVDDPVALQERKDAILAGYPAVVLHPTISARCLRKLASRMYMYIVYVRHRQ